MGGSECDNYRLAGVTLLPRSQTSEQKKRSPASDRKLAGGWARVLYTRLFVSRVGEVVCKVSVWAYIYIRVRVIFVL